LGSANIVTGQPKCDAILGSVYDIYIKGTHNTFCGKPAVDFYVVSKPDEIFYFLTRCSEHPAFRTRFEQSTWPHLVTEKDLGHVGPDEYILNGISYKRISWEEYLVWEIMRS
jgi:hypothetical protein